MAQDFRVDDSELRRFAFGLSRSHQRTIHMAGRYLRLMGKYTKRRMKRYADSKTSRSTGNLASSISSKYDIGGDSLSAEIYVPEDIKYQFAAEYGIKRKRKIYGRPKMTFPAEHWGVSQRTTLKVPHRGYFVFTQITRGRYKGKFFTKRAFEDVKTLYESKLKERMAVDLEKILLRG